MAWNLIQLELEEMLSNPCDDFKCLALESNPRDWHFAIRGPNGTEFEGGIYHGRIQFSEEYPSKPPILTLLTENGRFKTQTRIYYCLGDVWGPHNRVRDALLILSELLPTYPDGALGSVGYNITYDRRSLAIKSRVAAPKYGTAEHQKLIDEIHEYMLSKVAPVPSNWGGDIRGSFQNDLDKRIPGINILAGNQNDLDKRIPGINILVGNQNDLDKRIQSINILVGNQINANNSKRVGIFGFANNYSKKAKQVVSSSETSSTSSEDSQE